MSWYWASLVAQMVKNQPVMWETQIRSLGQEDLLEKGIATHSSILWRRQWQPTPVFLPGESQGQRSLIGCRLWGCRVRHDWSDLAVAASILAWEIPWTEKPDGLLCPTGHKELDTTEQLTLSLFIMLIKWFGNVSFFVLWKDFIILVLCLTELLQKFVSVKQPEDLFCGKGFNYAFNFFSRYSGRTIKIFYSSCVNLSTFYFSRDLFHLYFQIYWHKVFHSIFTVSFKFL